MKAIDFDFDRAVLGYYLENGVPGTAQDIADFAEVPVSRVRKVIKSCCYRSVLDYVERPVIEQNYFTVSHYRRVDAYVPSREALRAEILALRGKASVV